MASELQERIARALFERRLRCAVSDEDWAKRVASFRELSAGWPAYANGADAISDAFRDALIAMEAMFEPTTGSVEAGGNYVLQEGGIDPMHVDDRGPPYCIKGRETGSYELWRVMVAAEISLAEGGSRDCD